MRPKDIIAADPKFTASRKISLYSNFERLKTTNEYGYNANISTWRAAIVECVKAHCFENQTILNTANLLNELADDVNGIPRAINFVLDDMVANKDLVPLKLWLDSPRPLLRSTWSPSSALSWAWHKVFPFTWNSGSSGKLVPEQYVCIEVLKPVAEKLYKTLDQRVKQNGANLTAKVIPTESLDLTMEDIRACIVYLRREQNKQVHFDPENNIVVFDAQVREEHQTIAHIHRQMGVLDSRAAVLQTKLNELETQARAAVNSKQTAVAKQKLRSKAETEKNLAKTLALHSQLETVLANVDIASDQSSAFEALEKSTRLLRSINSTVGSSDKVAETMDSLQDELADTEEITNQLGRLSVNSPAIDDEVEDELEKLEAEMAGSRLDKINVPLQVPSHVPQEASVPQKLKGEGEGPNSGPQTADFA